MPRLNLLRNPFVQQYLLELLFPIIGYYFFGWGILIIGLYYLIDYLASLVMFVRRGVWVNRFANKKVSLIFILLFAGILLAIYLTVMLVFVQFTMTINQQSIQVFLSEMSAAFLSELWFLIPLVFVMYVFKYRFTFFMPRRYLNYNPKRYHLAELVLNGVLLSLFGVFAYVAIHYLFAEYLLIPIFLVGKIVFDITVRRMLHKWSLN